MAIMGKYCKAYSLARLAEWPEWASKVKPGILPAKAEDGAAQETYAFLQENYTATAGVFLDQEVLFDDVTPEWTRFCKETLQFEPPNLDAVYEGPSAPSTLQA